MNSLISIIESDSIKTAIPREALMHSISDAEIFDLLKKNPSNKESVRTLLVNLISTSVRKKASALHRSGSLDLAFVFQQWIQLVSEDGFLAIFSNDYYDPPPSEAPLKVTEHGDVGQKMLASSGSCSTPHSPKRSSEQRMKLLAIALIWLLEEPSSDSRLIESHYSRILEFQSVSVVHLQKTMLSCSAAMMEVTNESMEQVVKAVVILLRKESKKEAVEDSDQTNLTFLTCLQDSICNLLQQHNDQLCLSKAVLSQCGMAYAALKNILQPDCEIEHCLHLFEEASLVCVIHGLMVLASSPAGLKRIQLHHSLILQTLMRFTSSQDPVLLTLTVRTVALWANLALSGCWMAAKLTLKDPLCARLELVIWDLWDTHVEMAKGHLREIFNLLLTMHFRNCEQTAEKEDDHIGAIVRRCMESDFEKKKPYHVLQILVDHVPATTMLEQYPQLPRKLLGMLMDQSKSQICQMTLTKMVHSHWRTLHTTSTQSMEFKRSQKQQQQQPKTEECDVQNGAEGYHHFRRVWIDELLALQQTSLSDSFRVNAGFIHYIKVLFKVDALSFQYIMQQKNLKLTVKLMIIKSAIDQNLFPNRSSLDSTSVGCEEMNQFMSTDGRSWRGIVPMIVMYEAVWSYSSQVLQDVLWLLVHPTKSTTEPLMDEDIELLKEFYRLNLTNQSPAFRHNVYQWTNRLFVRMKDRLMMKKGFGDVSFWELQKQLYVCYQNFLIWMLDMCWDSFYLDASFSRKHLCLQFVKDLLTIFRSGYELEPIFSALVDWITVLEEKNENSESRLFQLIGLFHDSVQMNKDLALDIILLIPVDKLRWVQRNEGEGSADKLFTQAMHFARSVKSEQYPAAANLFILLTLCPSLEFLNGKYEETIVRQRSGPGDVTDPAVKGGDDLGQRNLLTLITFLTDQVSHLLDGMAGMKLLQAATTPIHGLLHCIFALVKRVPFFDRARYGRVVQDIVRVCITACDIVFPVVKQVAPEGYMPPDSEVVLALNEFKRKCTVSDDSTATTGGASEVVLNPSESIDTKPIPVTAQMVVFCSWRIVKEACFIMADLVVKYKPVGRHLCAITPSDIVNISDYITKLVVECRHLGAFEKSFLALQQIMKFLWVQKSGCYSSVRNKPKVSEEVDATGNEIDIELSVLPDMWIEKVLEEVKDPERAKKFCLTRRSAGVPRYLEALLTTCPQLEIGQKVKKVFVALLQCAQLPESNELTRRSKIHALNILRYLFRCSAIRQLVHCYVTDALKTSLNGFSSLVWPVQNASNLLFTSILSRVFGVLPDPMKLTRKNCMNFGEFFSKFPDLHDFLLVKLSDILHHYNLGKGKDKMVVTSGFEDNLEQWEPTQLSIEHLSAYNLATNAVLYPILLLLERLFVSENEQKSYNFFFAVLRFLDWPVARIRLLVARVLPNLLIDSDSVNSFVHFLFTIILPTSSPDDRKTTTSKLNSVHGALLTVKSLCDTIHTSSLTLGAVSKQLKSRFGSVHEMRELWPRSQTSCGLTNDLIIELWSHSNFEEQCTKEWDSSQHNVLIRSLMDTINQTPSDHPTPVHFQFDHFWKTVPEDGVCLFIESLCQTIASDSSSRLKRFLLGNEQFYEWLSDLFMEKDAFSCERTIALCNFVIKVDFELRDSLYDHILQHFQLYSEECQPLLIKVLSRKFVVTSYFDRRKNFVSLLLTCSKPFAPESVRMSVAEVLTADVLRRDMITSCEESYCPMIWCPVFLLLFDDCPQVRQVICSNVSPLVQCDQTSRKDIVFSPMKLCELAVDLLETNLRQDGLLVVFGCLLEYQLGEICGSSEHLNDEYATEEADMGKQEVLFEPTELNTFKESFRLVRISLNFLNKRSELDKNEKVQKTVQHCVDFLKRDSNLNATCNKVLSVLLEFFPH